MHCPGMIFPLIMLLVNLFRSPFMAGSFSVLRTLFLRQDFAFASSIHGAIRPSSASIRHLLSLHRLPFAPCTFARDALDSCYPTFPPLMTLCADAPRRDCSILAAILTAPIRTPTTTLPPLLRACRTALFPHNALAPPRSAAPSSPAQIAAVKHACALALLEACPPAVLPAMRTFFAAEDRDALVEEVEHVLDVLGDRYANKHLVFAIIELVVVRLIPELAQRGADDLLAERLG